VPPTEATATRERILDGAASAVALHGLAKVDMGDVSRTSGLSRGTVYRYFPNRDALLGQLANREGTRFRQRLLDVLAQAPPGPERILIALEHAARHVHEHRMLQRILETDPGLVLRAVRRQFEGIKNEFRPVLAPTLETLEPVRRGAAEVDDLVDWMTRLMLSAYLFPSANPEDMARKVTAVFRALSPAPGRKTTPSRRRRGARRK
jgi:AcrR family transcriptional regulator